MNDDAKTGDGPYTEVWNDAVDLRHLFASLLIGVAGGLPLFLIARALLRGTLDTPALADGYALLAGLAGCLIAGTICARLFPPKRTFADDDGDAAGSAALRRAALAELVQDGDDPSPDRLPPAVREELRELGLLDETAAPTTREEAGTR
ncbi:hypothetical protein [Actinomadura rugatobispora]|uniref:Uncharacterized protein n=1 Tax=Actinomadura rugatobispora TaxID=1994 RepID=A0ABW1AEY5_9ACTN|nr:hypothetical protein GCM10010200_025060 [Actinomadura rugatobispora]